MLTAEAVPVLCGDVDGGVRRTPGRCPAGAEGAWIRRIEGDAIMPRIEPVVLTNMCMVCDGDRILVQDRRNPDWPGITFPGGHVEPKESIVRSVIREVKEETGLDISEVRLCGMKQFTQRDGAFRYIVFFFKTDKFEGVLKSSGEGKVFWIDRKDLYQYQLADGFEGMLEIFENDALTENYWWADREWHCENL